jgi:hypothetical protein
MTHDDTQFPINRDAEGAPVYEPQRRLAELLAKARTEFRVHMLNEQGKAKATAIATVFTQALNQVEDIIGTEGREVALVRTKMEEASFFAKKAMASRPENQQGA